MTQNIAEDPRKRPFQVRNDTSVVRSDSGVAFGVTAWREKPTPTIGVTAAANGVEVDAELTLGGTVSVAGETFRLIGISSPQGGQVVGTLRLVEPGDPEDPLVSDVFETAELLPFGPLEPARVDALERDLGQRLPPVYRAWLQANNGAQPAKPYKLGDMQFVLTQATPLLGLHPDYPPYDLTAVQRRYREYYFTPEHIVIATPGGAGGLLTVSTGGRTPADSVNYLPAPMMAGELDPAEREKLLRPAGVDIHWFLGVLTPYELPS